MKNDVVNIEKSRGTRKFDAATSFGLFEIKKDMRNIRNLRASLLELAQALSNETNKKGYLVLVEPRISFTRLEEEWKATNAVLSADVSSRLSILIYKDQNYMGIPAAPDKREREAVSDFIIDEEMTGMQLPRSDYFFVVLKILVRQWFLNAEPVTTTWLMEKAGCSYPTVAKVINRLGRVIERQAYKKIKLGRFPKEAWSQLLAVSDHARATVRFGDTSGQPRSPDSLIRRLNNMHISEIAIGGAPGARYLYPKLDLLGIPRLDLSVHCPRNRLDLSFVHKLDPALKIVEDQNEPASLVVHVVRRKSSMFERGKSGGINWADPGECLLDLYEMHLHKQAGEFIKAAPLR